MKTLAIAMLCHSINAAYCQSLGDESQLAWEDSPDSHQQSLIAGVEMHLANPQATPEQSHESWYAQKEAEGWVYGEVKDANKKEHPCFLPYDELPLEQKAKDYLFRATVHLMKDLPNVEEYLALADEVKHLREKIQKNALNVPNVVTPTATPLGASGIAIQYVGRKDQFTDRLYGSNLTFVKGQVRHVPSNIAGSLLKHPEFQLYEQQVSDSAEQHGQQTDDTSKILDEAKKQQDKDNEKETIELDEIDTVERISDKKSLIDYAKNKYDQELDGRSSVKTLQGQVVDLIKRFGVV
ncbi:MAG: RyR domain-containing protein [Acinetobacter sp.]